MPINPIYGMYVHDEETDTDGIAKFSSEELEDIRVGADGVTYANAGDAVRAQAFKHGMLEILNNELFSYTPISPSATSNNWCLTGTGLSTQNSTAKLDKYTVTEGTLLHLKLSKDNDGVYQFQSGTNVPATAPNNALVGEPVAVATNGIVEVPTGATYLIVSQNQSNTDNHVFLASSVIGEIENDCDATREIITGYTYEVTNGGTGTKKFNKTILAGETYTYTNTGTAGQSLHLYKDGSTVQTISNGVFSNQSVTFTATQDADQIGGYFNATAAFTLEYVGMLPRLKALESAEPPEKEHIVNARSRTAPHIILNCQSGETWNADAGGTITADTADYIAGSQSLIISSNATAPLSAPVDLRKKYLTATIKVDTLASVNTLYVMVSDSTSFTNYKRVPMFRASQIQNFELGVWRTVYIDLDTGTTSGTVDMENIRAVRFYTGATNYSFHVQNIGWIEKGTQPGCVSFTFDDGYASVLDGARVLAKYGISGTAFVFSGCEMTVAQLQTLKQVYNWDIELHGTTAFTSYTAEDLDTYVKAQKEFIVNNGLGEGKHMAYPNGAVNSDIVTVVAKYCVTGRTIDDKLETFPVALPFNIHACSSAGSSVLPLNTIKSMIDTAAATGSWLILVFHRIGDTESSMYCSEKTLGEIAEYAVNSGAEIRTFADAWERA